VARQHRIVHSVRSLILEAAHSQGGGFPALFIGELSMYLGLDFRMDTVRTLETKKELVVSLTPLIFWRPQGDSDPCCRRESAAKKPYSAILNPFKPFKTHLNAIKSRLDLRLKLLSVNDINEAPGKPALQKPASLFPVASI